MAIKKRSVAVSSQDDSTDTMNSLPEFGSGMMPRAKKSFPWLALIILIVVVVLGGGVYMYGRNASWWGKPSMKAIFLVNGQVYFGQISRESSRDLYVNNVYYIQLQDQVDPTAAEGDQSKTVQVPTLLKRGEELHRPYGDMRINREQVVAIENVGADSPIFQQIQQLNSPQK